MVILFILWQTYLFDYGIMHIKLASKNLFDSFEKSSSCFVIHDTDSVNRICLPFGNTFGLFCFLRVQDALLGNVSPTFRRPRVLMSTPIGDIIPPFPLLKPHGELRRILGRHIRLYKPDWLVLCFSFR